MIADLRALYRLLEPRQRRRLLWLQCLIVLMALGEIISVVAVAQFMALIGNPGRLTSGEGRLAWLYQLSGSASPEAFLLLVGGGALAALVLAGACSGYTTWRLSLYGAQIGAELSSRLYRDFLHRPWLFHVRHSSSRLMHKTSQEVQRLTQRIVIPCLQLNARLVLVVFMSIMVFLYNPWVALTGVAIFVGAYLLLYRTVRKALIATGKRVSRHQAERYQLMSEGFGGIRELLLWHRQGPYVQRFEAASQKVARGQGVSQGLGEAPRYAIELLAFGSVILLVLYLLGRHDGEASHILPALSVYALAGFKMLPAFQRIYVNVARIRGNLAAFEVLREDLAASRDAPPPVSEEPSVRPLVPAVAIELEEVSFRYPRAAEAALSGVSLRIPANHMVGLVGASGSGKSTLVDILLGLLTPDAGRVTIDGVPLDAARLRRWQEGIGFVPQQIFLTEGSIRENVAFGMARDAIDEPRVLEAVRMAQLDELVASLPDGLDSHVGERGVQLSGGQRQRIGIARALYRRAGVLVFDEATSALDGVTERQVMADIQRFAGQMTVVLIAHRLGTVRHCDTIYMLDHGRLVDAGDFDGLASRNATFRLMADL